MVLMTKNFKKEQLNFFSFFFGLKIAIFLCGSMIRFPTLFLVQIYLICEKGISLAIFGKTKIALGSN
jgi:hypothetical protein